MTNIFRVYICLGEMKMAHLISCVMNQARILTNFTVPAFESDWTATGVSIDAVSTSTTVNTRATRTLVDV